MSEVRVIKFNEDLFKIPSGTQRKKPDKPIKVKAQRKVSDKTLRNRVLNEIRKNQEMHYKSLITGTKGALGGTEGALERTESGLSQSGGGSKEFNKDFDKSLEYMNQLAGKVKEEEKSRNTTLRLREYSNTDSPIVREPIENLMPVNNLIHVQMPVQSVGGEPIKLAPSLPYGCMKVGGSLPTYRAYHQTQKNYGSYGGIADSTARETGVSLSESAQSGTKSSLAQPIREPILKPVETLKEQSSQALETSLEKPLMVERILSPTEVAQQEKAKQQLAGSVKPKVKRIKKLLRRTYRAGKDKHRPRVGVLLPNKTLRSNVTTKAYMLKQTPIEEIRKTLVKKGFIKHGSSAPNDVLRKIYESIQMIGGEVSNYNADNLLYNFFETKEHA
jgi:hypothetical protein